MMWNLLTLLLAADFTAQASSLGTVIPISGRRGRGLRACALCGIQAVLGAAGPFACLAAGPSAVGIAYSPLRPPGLEQAGVRLRGSGACISSPGDTGTIAHAPGALPHRGARSAPPCLRPCPGEAASRAGSGLARPARVRLRGGTCRTGDGARCGAPLGPLVSPGLGEGGAAGCWWGSVGPLWAGRQLGVAATATAGRALATNPAAAAQNGAGCRLRLPRGKDGGLWPGLGLGRKGQPRACGRRRWLDHDRRSRAWPGAGVRFRRTTGLAVRALQRVTA